MVKGVEFTNVREFEKEMKRMPNFALHELAHAFHDRVLGFDQAEIEAAYEHAKTSKRYDLVERWHGDGRPNTHERAYAMTDAREYFAESTEAFFSRNDFFPFTRQELQQHDPEMFNLLQRLWSVPPPGKTATAR
jgi:Mlc titration factor MtfA (ptsG expression regulator)